MKSIPKCKRRYRVVFGRNTRTKLVSMPDPQCYHIVPKDHRADNLSWKDANEYFRLMVGNSNDLAYCIEEMN